MKLSSEEAIYAANIFINYFSDFRKIDDYFRSIKKERMTSTSMFIPGIGPEEDMFNDFDLHPTDMGFKIISVGDNENYTTKFFNTRLEIICSHLNEYSIPGKSLRWVVVETNTDKIVGFIHLGSPTIRSKPRNDWLGGEPELFRFNRHVIMGFILVPVQPFGFNYLGGKLLALLACSHEARSELNKKYDVDICLFETTSLYGDSKLSSQYDGLKPYLKYKGFTQSDFIPLLHDYVFLELNEWFKSKNDGIGLVKDNASSRKLKIQQKMVAIIMSSLKGNPKLEQFKEVIKKAKKLTERKRYYISNYGFKNSREVIIGESDSLIEDPVNFDKFYSENLIKWWKNKASKRYESLKLNGRFRTEMEVWSKRTDIDIIR